MAGAPLRYAHATMSEPPIAHFFRIYIEEECSWFEHGRRSFLLGAIARCFAFCGGQAIAPESLSDTIG